jgi:hypothetical protein
MARTIRSIGAASPNVLGDARAPNTLHHGMAARPADGMAGRSHRDKAAGRVHAALSRYSRSARLESVLRASLRLGIALLFGGLVLQIAATDVGWGPRLGLAVTSGGLGLVLGWVGIRWLALLPASRSSRLWKAIAGLHAVGFALCGISGPVWAVLYLAGLTE